jgi:hypothetical protein
VAGRVLRNSKGQYAGSTRGWGAGVKRGGRKAAGKIKHNWGALSPGRKGIIAGASIGFVAGAGPVGAGIGGAIGYRVATKNARRAKKLKAGI